MVQVVKYFVPSGTSGMKKRVKYRRDLVRACAAGVWQWPHITKMVANLADFRRNPNKMIISLPHFAPRAIRAQLGEAAPLTAASQGPNFAPLGNLSTLAR